MNNRNGSWGNLRILFKSALIGALILLLLIPTTFIQSLVTERQQRQTQAVAEIGSRWAGSQTLSGPVIGIPYMDTTPANNGDKQRIKRWAWFLPGKLNVKTRLIPEKRYRGIYQVIVYTSEMDIHGSYDAIHLNELGLSPDDMIWKEALVFFDVSDIEGLNEDPVLHLQAACPTPFSADLALRPGQLTTTQFKETLSANLPEWSLRALPPWIFPLPSGSRERGTCFSFQPVARPRSPPLLPGQTLVSPVRLFQTCARLKTMVSRPTGNCWPSIANSRSNGIRLPATTIWPALPSAST